MADEGRTGDVLMLSVNYRIRPPVRRKDAHESRPGIVVMSVGALAMDAQRTAMAVAAFQNIQLTSAVYVVIYSSLSGPRSFSNLGYVLDQMRTAKACAADVAHFPEACLSGYAGIDMSSHEGFNWPRLTNAVRDVLALAGKLHLWVVLGSAHRLTKPNKPHNSLYIIDDEGRLIDRYDKRFCSGDVSGDDRRSGALLARRPLQRLRDQGYSLWRTDMCGLSLSRTLSRVQTPRRCPRLSFLSLGPHRRERLRSSGGDGRQRELWLQSSYDVARHHAAGHDAHCGREQPRLD
jgi:hypothetical protein